MNIGVTTALNNLGVSLEWLVIIVYFFGGFIFYARDFKIGAILDFVIAGAIFAWFYQASYTWAGILTIFFARLVIISLSLYAVQKTADKGGIT